MRKLCTVISGTPGISVSLSVVCV